MGDYSVYMHVNRANGKRYIGITSGNPLKRWANGKGYYRNKHFSDAIIKYGWDNFDHVILFSGIEKDEACKEEQRLIKKYGTQDKNKGYNLTSGGEHFKHSDFSRELMSEKRKGVKPPPFTEEHKARLRENHSGGADCVTVICIETGKIYESINDAARATGINKKGISGCVRRLLHYNTAGGFHWKYAE